MRKLLLITICVCSVLAVRAESLDVAASYIYSSDYNQARVGLAIPLGLHFRAGVEGKYVEDKMEVEKGGLKDPVYSVYLPLQFDLDMATVGVMPFYYFKNKSYLPGFDDASAYGIASHLNMNLVRDEVNEVYTQAFVDVSFARQKASLQNELGNWSNEYYDQLVYTLGLRQNLYNSFAFQVAATAYQYPDGITRVQNFRGILDQKDLSFTQSFDVSRALAKYALSARFTRMWPEKRSSLYVGYHYAEFYTANPEHSALLGNTFFVSAEAAVDIAYNHLQDTDGKNKRDVGYIHLNIAF